MKRTMHKKACQRHSMMIESCDVCQTDLALQRVVQERSNQFLQYGDNRWEDGTGPRTAWLLPLAPEPAQDIETVLRQDYEDYEEEVGAVTWVHLVREEVAEAFKEDDPVRLTEELIQVAALCVSWVEDIERRRRDAAVQEAEAILEEERL